MTRYTGTISDNTLSGGPEDDEIFGGGGNDTLDGGGGADLLYGESGDDTLHSGAGSGRDGLYGGPGDDVLIFESPGGWADPGLGADEVRGAGGTYLTYASNYTAVTVDLRAGTATGLGISDRISGIGTVRGTGLDDRLLGGGAGDYEGFVPGAGDDFIDGRGGYDEVRYDVAQGGAGVDLDFRAGLAIDPFGGRDALRRVEMVRGSHQDDVLRGGGAPFEAFRGLAGADLIDGRGGYDQADYGSDAAAGGAGALRADLRKGEATDGFGDLDRLMRIEQVIGTSQDDVIKGDGRRINRLEGGEGDDRLVGRGGRDELIGGEGEDLLKGGRGPDLLAGGPDADRLLGGAGRDVFVLVPGTGRDLAADFRPGQDRIDVSATGAERFADLDISLRGGDAMLRTEGGALRLDGTRPNELDADDFIFA